MDEIVFRDMTTEDAEIVKALINSLYSEDAPGGSNENRAEITIYGIMDKPSRGRIIMMEWYGKIVGYGIVVFCWNVEFCGEIVNIEDIYVEPSYRSLGIGESFIHFIEEEYKNTVVGITLEVSPSNLRAKSFYKKNGYTISESERMVKYDIP